MSNKWWSRQTGSFLETILALTSNDQNKNLLINISFYRCIKFFVDLSISGPMY